MCLAFPAQIVKILAEDQAVVEVGGIEKEISLGLVKEVQVGDYVIVHVGFALTKLDQAAALQTLALLDEITQGVGA